MPKVMILKGLPGSGKSTWAKNKVATSSGNWKRINKDDLRAMIDNSVFSSDNERLITQVRDQLILTFLKRGRNVIIDDTNLHPKHERKIRSIVPHGTEVEVMFMDVDIETCIARDAKREGKAHVGEKVIRRMAKEWESWKHLDPTIKQDEDRETVEWIEGLPTIVMCDLDGTAALMCDRSPYDWKRCIDDTPNEAVREVLWAMTRMGHDIVYMSGRDGICREETETWLPMHDFPDGELHMREINDQRKDSIVKRELFDAHIRGKYNVLFVLDDRNQVVDEWRAMGLTCFQVAEGNF